jgi:Helicase C-terminal domain
VTKREGKDESYAMPAHIPRPVEEIVPWGEQTRTRFPRHVVAKLTELILTVDDTCEEEREDYSIGYRHLLGTLERSDGFPLTTVQFWIASHDSARLLLWLPGSWLWIRPDSHYLYFDEIEPSLLPEQVDYSTVWVVDAVYTHLEARLRFPLLRQGDMPRQELTNRFRSTESAVLFGLKSFWEGVDIAGEALSLVVIDKMPFDPPDDPVHEA